MTDLAKIYKETELWIYFEGETKDEIIGVYCRCPRCGGYVKRGRLLMNRAGEIKLEGFTCKRHGEIQPYYDRG